MWSQTAEILPPLSPTDPAKGIAEVVMIPVVGAIANAVAHATGKRPRPAHHSRPYQGGPPWLIASSR